MLRVIGNDQNLPRQEHAIASGTLTNGKTVIINADGTVSVVSGIATSAGSATLNDGNKTVSNVNVIYDANAGKIVLVYRDITSTYYGTAQVGTVSGTSISFGTPVTFNSNNSQHITAVYDANAQKVVVIYGDDGNSNHGTAKVGTVSGTGISFGSGTVWNASDCSKMKASFDSSANKIVIIYKDEGNSDHGTAIVGTVSGTSISFGSEAVFNSASTTQMAICYDTNASKHLIAYNDQNLTGEAKVATVSGTSISFGSEVNLNSASISNLGAVYDDSVNKCVIGYYRGGPAYAKVATISGTSVSFGSEAQITSNTAYEFSLGYNKNTDSVIGIYKDNSNSNKLTYAAGTVSGTSISFASSVVLNDTTDSTSIGYHDAQQKNVTFFKGTSNYGTAIVFSNGSTNLTSENYIGISRSGAASGAGAIIDTQGAIADNLSGLTAGQSYFVQNDGTLGTTAASPSVFAGTAVSATKLIVKG